MCESNAYLKDGENEVMLMESVDSIEPFENGLKLMDIFGKEIFVKAKIINMKPSQPSYYIRKITLS